MPGSDISRVSVGPLFGPRSEMAAYAAKEIARKEINLRIQRGLNDKASIEREYRNIYRQEYYKYYAHFAMQESLQPKYIYVPTENQSAKKYMGRHTVANFSRLNCFVHVHRNCITVGRINYPLDEDVLLDTMEAFISEWPGPLDRSDKHLLSKVTRYTDNLWQHDSQRRIKYCIGANDDQRRTILGLLNELLNRRGSIDAPAISRLLLTPDQTDIQKHEGNSKPLETLQKYLLLGKRSEALKFARAKKLWDHAQCLAFLDKYQPPNTGKYFKHGSRLKDDFIVILNDEYISSLTENKILNIVYRSLLNKILQSDPESINIIKHANVEDNYYQFAILSANDCDMHFNQSNEIFKLIVAVKQTLMGGALPTDHLISLGHSIKDEAEIDDLSYRSHISFKPADTYTPSSQTITNLDLLILNEIWEYCLNLVRDTCNPSSYEYIIDLVPYKLIFASRLLDYGLYEMFANYLNSIKNALVKAKSRHMPFGNPVYDWETIQKCVEYLSGMWELYRMSPDALAQKALLNTEPDFQQQHQQQPMFDQVYNYQSSFNPAHTLPSPMIQNEPQYDYNESPTNDYPSMPYQGESVQQQQLQPPPSFNISQTKYNVPPPIFKQPPTIQEEFTNQVSQEPISSQIGDKNAYEPNQNYADYSSGPSNKPSLSQEMPVFSPPPFGHNSTTLPERSQKPMTSSSPVHKNRDSLQSNPPTGDSFNSPFSPINQYDDLPRGDSDLNRNPSTSANNAVNNDQMVPDKDGNQTQSNNKSQATGDQQGSSFFTNLVGSAKALLPKSNSKQMILPDDRSKSIIYDDKKGGWVDTSQPEDEGANDQDDAPPMMNITKPPSYSYVTKSSKLRYPKAQF